MAKDIKFNLKAVDKISSTLDKVTKKFPKMNRVVRDSTAAFKKLEKQSRASRESLDKIGKSAARVGKDLSTKLTLPLTAVAGFGIREFAKFEQGVTDVVKTTGLEFDETAKIIDGMAGRIPVATENLLEIAGAAGQLGVKGADNIEIFTETFAKLEKASDVAGEEGAKAIARLLTVTGDGIGKVDKFAATLVELGNNSAASESEILTMATRVGQATAQFELGSKTTLGISAAMKSLGIQAEAGGTVIGKTFRAISDAIDNGGKSMGVLQQVTGKTQAELKKAFEQDAGAVFQDFISNLGELADNGVKTTSILAEFGLSGERVNAIIPTMAKSADVLTKSMGMAGKAFDENTALNKEFEQQTKTLNATIQMFQNRLGKTLRVIGDKLAPALSKVLGIVGDLMDAFAALSPGMQTAIIAAGAIAAALGPAIFAFGMMAKSILAIKTAMIALGPVVVAAKAVFAAIAGVISAPVLAIGALVAAIGRLIYKWDELKKSFSAGGIGSALSTFFDFIPGVGGDEIPAANTGGVNTGALNAGAAGANITQTNNASVAVDFTNLPQGAQVSTSGIQDFSATFAGLQGI